MRPLYQIFARADPQPCGEQFLIAGSSSLVYNESSKPPDLS
jgi:hypothetical protein